MLEIVPTSPNDEPYRGHPQAVIGWADDTPLVMSEADFGELRRRIEEFQRWRDQNLSAMEGVFITLKASSDGFMAALAALWPAMEEAVERSLPIIADFAQAMLPYLDPRWRYSPEEQEEKYRAYATWYNARHPARRLSWRRLNRPQRYEAFNGNYCTRPNSARRGSRRRRSGSGPAHPG